MNNNELFKLLNECDTAFATLFIGSDHGITPQAWEACQEAAKRVRECLAAKKTPPVDLFECIDTLPSEVQAILNMEEFSSGDYSYEVCNKLQLMLHAVGYTFDYYLDAEPYNLRVITPDELLLRFDHLTQQLISGTYNNNEIEGYSYDDNGTTQQVPQHIIELIDFMNK